MSLPKDFSPGLIVLAICGWLFYLTTQFDTDPLGMAQGMPATHMPRLVLGVIAFLALFMMVQGFRAGKAEATGSPPWKMWATAAILGAAAALFETIGVPLAFFAVCVSVPTLWGARNYAAIGLFAVMLPAAIYGVFQGLLGLRLPLGPLSFLAI